MNSSTKLTFAFGLTLLTACGGASDAADKSSGSSKASTVEWATDPAELPSDQAGLVDVYKSMMEEVVSNLEGAETKEQLDAGLKKIRGMGPAFAALMKRSEEIEVPLDQDNPEVDALVERMNTAMKSVLQKFPEDSMTVMNTFSEMMGGVGPR